MISILAVIILSALGVAADFCIKLSGQAAKGMDLRWLVAGIVLYTLTLPGLFFVLKYVKLSRFGAIYSVSSVLLLVAVGFFYFHEKISLSEVAGVVLSLVALFLLSRFA